MNYEIVTRDEMIVIGMNTKTNNNAVDMGVLIGSVWNNFFNSLHESGSMKSGSHIYGIYTEYSSDETGDYTFAAACECMEKSGIPKEAKAYRLPAGKYAKFTVKGELQKAIPEFWQKLWAMDLPRSFVCDFEEYKSPDMEFGSCEIYIGLK